MKSRGIFLLGDTLYFLYAKLIYMNLVKMQIPWIKVEYKKDLSLPIFLFRFVWRQSEFAFFGASASVGAPFIFRRRIWLSRFLEILTM